MVVSLKRIDYYLNEEEEINEGQVEKSANDSDDNPSFSNATFSCQKADGQDNTSCQLKDLDVTFSKGELNLIVGPVGSGKSLMLLALLGELHLCQGRFHLPRQNGVSYAAQNPWLQNATIRDNILFGTEFDEERYWKVVEACALNEDLDRFEAGDRTEVGERGVTLSGGQKQRLALARAVYSRAQTVLLDDVLSPLDVHVGKFIFEKCITGELLRGRTVLLITRHLAMAQNAAMKIIVMNHGRISSVQSPESFANVCIDTLLQDKTDPGAASATVDTNPDGLEKSGKLVVEEESAVGRISRTTMFQYIGNFGGPFFIATLWAVVFLGNTGFILSDWWIAQWSDAYTKYGTDTNVPYYLGVAALIAASIAIMEAVESTFYQRGAWTAAKTLHWKLVRGVFRAPISWFDVTPVGRIINRVATDISSLDSRLVGLLQYLIYLALQLVFRIGAVASVIPIFVLPAVVVACVGYVLGEVYVRVNTAVKRCHSETKSPIFSHFGEAVLGAVTIRACCFLFLELTVDSELKNDSLRIILT